MFVCPTHATPECVCMCVCVWFDSSASLIWAGQGRDLQLQTKHRRPAEDVRKYFESCRGASDGMTVVCGAQDADVSGLLSTVWPQPSRYDYWSGWLWGFNAAEKSLERAGRPVKAWERVMLRAGSHVDGRIMASVAKCIGRRDHQSGSAHAVWRSCVV